MTAAAPSGPLVGLRVIDLTQMLSGPYCTMMLADQGAEVIKIEPVGGEYVRFNAPFLPSDTQRAYSGYWGSVNRNKKSMGVDLRSPEGRALLIRLCDSADAVVENYRVGVMDRLGLSFETLHASNPRLVYASIRGFGDPRTGRSPYADWPAYDVVAQAVGGVMAINGPDRNTPIKVGPGVGDIFPGALAAFGIVSAVLHAQKTGRGQYVDVAMADAVLALSERILHQYATLHTIPGPEGNRHPMFALFGTVPAKDGWVTVAGHTDRFWTILCTALNRPDLLQDARSATQEARIANQDFVYDEIGAVTSQLTKRELAELLGGKLPFGSVNNVIDILGDPHFAVREMVVEVEQPGSPDRLPIAGVPIRMTETQGVVHARAPILGEHTDEILTELGYPVEAIAALRRQSVVA